MSPARRRECIDHVTKKFDVSERLACLVLGQHRSTQCKAPKPVSEPVAVTDDTAIVVELQTGGRLRIAASTPPALAATVLKALR